MLDIWPELPIIIDEYRFCSQEEAEGSNNIIDALELNDRVSSIRLLGVSISELERVVTVLKDPFPALTHLILWSDDEMAPVISDSFLGGSAPRLQHLSLNRIPFPALPKLPLSATDLVALGLRNIPHSGYISPEAMVACLSALTRLESLFLGFRSPRPRLSREKPPPTRTILPSLTHFDFKGVSEYLGDLVARIDTPSLKSIEITFFNQLVFDILQLPSFLCRTEKFAVLDGAKVFFEDDSIRVKFSSRIGTTLMLQISCSQLDWQLSSIAQVCNSSLSTLSTLERLDLVNLYDPYDTDLQLAPDDMENIQWLELLHPFPNVKNLHLPAQVTSCIAPALQELTGERVIEVLPALQNIFFNELDDGPEPVPAAIWDFGAARQLSGCPVDVHRRRWDSRRGTWVVIESTTQ